MTANLFSRFKRLAPGAPLLVGEVISATGGVVVVELPGGARIQARGAGTVGSQVFVRGDVIEGVAPSLTVVFIDI